MKNEMELKFLAISENEGFARVCASAFATQLDLTLDQLSDIKTAVSEAVTNAVVHAYNGQAGTVILRGVLEEDTIVLEVVDFGKGIEDVVQARMPLFTTVEGDERSGMGFTVMEALMDEVSVYSEQGKGTRVVMKKTIAG